MSVGQWLSCASPTLTGSRLSLRAAPGSAWETSLRALRRRVARATDFALSLEDWQEVAATAAEETKMQSSEVLTPPTLASTSSFPTLSRSTAPSLACPSSPAAPASGQGEVIAGCAHSLWQCVSRFAISTGHDVANVAHDFGRHVELNLEDRPSHCIQRRFDRNCKVVGNGGCSRNVNLLLMALADRP